MVCCCISCKAGPCSQGLPCQGPAELGEAVQTSLAVTSPRSCPRPWSFPWHRHTCWGGQWCLLPRPCSPGPVPTPGAHEVPAATFSHSCCPCQHGTVAWPPVRAPRRWAQPPVLQQGTQLRGYPSPQSQSHSWAPPGLFLSMGQQPRGVGLTQLGTGHQDSPFGSESSCSGEGAGQGCAGTQQHHLPTAPCTQA